MSTPEATHTTFKIERVFPQLDKRFDRLGDLLDEGQAPISAPAR